MGAPSSGPLETRVEAVEPGLIVLPAATAAANRASAGLLGDQLVELLLAASYLAIHPISWVMRIYSLQRGNVPEILQKSSPNKCARETSSRFRRSAMLAFAGDNVPSSLAWKDMTTKLPRSP
jgi:hypothetical protein